MRSAEIPGRSCLFKEVSSLRDRCSAAFQRRSFSMRVLHDAGGDTPIAKTLDCDLGFFARYLANPRTGGNAAMNLEPHSLCGCLAVGGDDNVDEIGHADLTIPDVIRELPCAIASAAIPLVASAITPGSPYIGGTRIKNPYEIGAARSLLPRPARAG